MDDTFLINIKIAGKEYPLTIDRKDERMVRAAASQINSKIIQYQASFPSTSLDMRDLLAMVAFQLSFENLQLEEKNDTYPFVEKIQQMSKELEDYLDR